RPSSRTGVRTPTSRTPGGRRRGTSSRRRGSRWTSIPPRVPTESRQSSLERSPPGWPSNWSGWRDAYRRVAGRGGLRYLRLPPAVPRGPRAPVERSRAGEWLSLVEHLLREQGVAGSKPVAPTMEGREILNGFRALRFCGPYRGPILAATVCRAAEV